MWLARLIATPFLPLNAVYRNISCTSDMLFTTLDVLVEEDVSTSSGHNASSQ